MTERKMIDLSEAGEAVSRMVKANAEAILTTKVVAARRQQTSRNALSESTFSTWELVSMLAVAIDRLAVWEALAPHDS